MIYATPPDIGTKRQCPDCYSAVEIQTPRPKQRRTSDVVDADYDDDDFALAPAAEVEVFKPKHTDVAAGSADEDVLSKARREQLEREREEPDLPLAPLWNGAFAFLPDSHLIGRMVACGVLVGLAMALALAVAGWVRSGDTEKLFYGLVGSFFLVALVAVTAIYWLSNLLTILQDSAEGCRQIESWPESSVGEWFEESLWVQLATFFAITPGMLVSLTSGLTGIPAGVCWLLTGLSFYAFFPVTQLSLLETGSLTNPYSKPILDSVRDQFLLWCTFYIMTFFLALAVGIVFFSIGDDPPVPIWLAVGGFFSLASFLYFRLLGRLAWACQMRPLLQTGKDDQDHESETSPDQAGDSE
jgi:hypothetical protein